MKELKKTYDPHSFEDRIYREWKEGGYFRADNSSDKEAYTIVMPPPNVTGSLHLGHAINNTLQDVLIRWKRMDGYEALWVPGTDHASISTEAKVVAKLESEGIQKTDLTREEFLEKAWEWTREYGGRINGQLEKLGVSCDWSRERFTLDETLSDAVLEVFIRMYEEGLIYQGDRIVNWCSSCGTAVSDIEVEHEDETGKLYTIKYPIKGEECFISIATTRPETLLGDLAVAVSPDDERYLDHIGKTLILPLVNREIPLLADEYVLAEFGTGAVKITPSHDPNDFVVGERHQLGQCVVIDTQARIVEGYGPYSGLDRYEARKRILEDLKSQGLLVSIEDHQHAVGHCERCSTTIEPLISKQWFVKMEGLAKPAKEAYVRGDLKLHPDRFGKIYVNWLDNIKDWCISRQLWWGHRLPVYYCQDCAKTIVSKTRPENCPDCGSAALRQDEDTLDTWFSSALWPFSTLGWPEQTQDLKKFFPTSVLVTGYDIIFFWVIRMVFSSLHQMGELPFKDVYFNGLVRDSQGRKMSKSLNNGIDPLDIIEDYGADALRFMLVSGNTPGNDLRFFTEKVEAARNFANKLWNASRFVLMNTGEQSDFHFAIEDLEIEDKWILTKLQKTIDSIQINLERYDLGIAAGNIYDFTWDEFCDWYIELVKSRLYGEDARSKQTAVSVLIYVLREILRLLHPFMPFITEEIYSYLPEGVKEDLLIKETWPHAQEELSFSEEARIVEDIIEGVKSIRNARSEMDIPPSKKSAIHIVTQSSKVQQELREGLDLFRRVGSADSVEILDKETGEEALTVIKSGYRILVPLAGLVDYQKELDRLTKERERIEQEIKRASGKLGNSSFTEKAPAAVVEQERNKLEKYEKMFEEILTNIQEVEGKL